MNEKSLHTLEYDKIVTALGAKTSFSASRKLANELRPTPVFIEAQHALEETSEAAYVLEQRPDITIGGARDVRPMVSRAELGGIVEPEDLLSLAATLASARSMRRSILRLRETDAELPWLADYAEQLHSLPDLESEIQRSIGERGEILDSASPTLGRIRQDLRRAHNRLQDLLRTILNSSAYSQAIQEPIISLREGRYVVPIKAEFRSKLPGIVHDTSGSGQTLFVEPLGVVEAGNNWRELQGREADEIERILMEFAARVADKAYEIQSTVEALAAIDFCLAKARYAADLNATRPQLVEYRARGDGPYSIHLPEARHPLLKGHVVPISVDLGDAFRVLVVTGPNTGGKTVALKTVGLLTLMAQSGLFIPTSLGARVPVFSNVFADVGDEQSIEQSLSTFSSHISNIVGMLRAAAPDTLMLLDELGAGTDPEEGSALARAIIDYLLERRGLAIATTHYVELKSYAHITPGVRNASVEFDEQTLSPTYRLIVGLPGRSNALSIAGRLGIPEDILEKARDTVSPESRELNDMLAQIQAERDAAVAEREQAVRERDEGRRLAEEARHKLAEAENIRDSATDEGRAQAERELEDFRRELATLRTNVQLASSRAEIDAAFQEAEQHTDKLRSRVSVRRRRRQPKRQAPQRSVVVGDDVLLKSLGTTGRVLDIADDTAEVQLGRLKTRVPVNDLQLQERPRKEPEQRGRTQLKLDTARPETSMELDLRGRRAEEVSQALDRYVDDAYLSGLPSLRIIHGKGTGVLRQVVRDFLKGHPLVEGIRSAPIERGGEGVTEASLARR